MDGAEKTLTSVPAEPMRAVLRRAQELVDRRPAAEDALAGHIEALHVGDLSALALLVRRTLAD